MDDYGFAEFFASYWWLLFPLAWFLAAGWQSFMRYKRAQSKIELLKAYAASGKEPPAELLAALDEKSADRAWDDYAREQDGKSGGGGTAFLVLLFAGLAAVFGYVGYSELLEGVREEFYFVAMILGVLAVAFLGAGLFGGKSRHER